MPLPRDVVDSMAERNDAAARLASRQRFRLWTKTLLLCWLWCLVGLFLVGWAVHTTNSFYGHISFFAGIGIGNGGTIATFVTAWRKAERLGLVDSRPL